MRTIFLMLFIMFSALLPLSVSADDIYVVTSSSKLNVRSQPSRSGTVIAQLRPGQEVRCIGTNGTWKHLRLDNGRQGYASAQFLSYRRPVNLQVNNPAPQSERSSSWWASPTGMIIILIIVSFCLGQLIQFLDIEGWFGALLAALSIGSYLGGIVGLLSWWIFDNFWTPYLVIVGIWIVFWLYKIISAHFEEKPYTGCDVIDWSDYSSGGSSSSSSSSYTPPALVMTMTAIGSDSKKKRKSADGKNAQGVAFVPQAIITPNTSIISALPKKPRAKPKLKSATPTTTRTALGNSTTPPTHSWHLKAEATPLAIGAKPSNTQVKPKDTITSTASTKTVHAGRASSRFTHTAWPTSGPFLGGGSMEPTFTLFSGNIAPSSIKTALGSVDNNIK